MEMFDKQTHKTLRLSLVTNVYSDLSRLSIICSALIVARWTMLCSVMRSASNKRKRLVEDKRVCRLNNKVKSGSTKY